MAADTGLGVTLEPRRRGVLLSERVEKRAALRVNRRQLEAALLYPPDVDIVVEVNRPRLLGEIPDICALDFENTSSWDETGMFRLARTDSR